MFNNSRSDEGWRLRSMHNLVWAPVRATVSQTVSHTGVNPGRRSHTGVALQRRL